MCRAFAQRLMTYTNGLMRGSISLYVRSSCVLHRARGLLKDMSHSDPECGSMNCTMGMRAVVRARTSSMPTDSRA